MNYPHPLIAREGWPFLAGSLAAACAVTYFAGGAWSIPFWVIALFVLQFFRDPPRQQTDDPRAVVSAADGRVVYAGSGLRGYGNLVIIKHNATYLTAYAHNQSLLVKDEQVVRRGQKIAEMGSSDADRVQLHFEIRRLGVPIDPMRLLPPR